jgi:hypothetical protein
VEGSISLSSISLHQDEIDVSSFFICLYFHKICWLRGRLPSFSSKTRWCEIIRKLPKYHVDQSKGAIPSGPFRLELFIEGMDVVTSIPTKITVIIIIAYPKRVERERYIAQCILLVGFINAWNEDSSAFLISL